MNGLALSKTDVGKGPMAWSSLASKQALAMLGVFLVLVITFQIMSDGLFLTPRNLTLLMRQGAIVSIVAMGVAILIIKGEIDLSTGSAVYLCGVAAALMQTKLGLPVVPTVVLTILCGIALGAWQGVWAVVLGVPSFVVTLAGLLAFRGTGYYLTDAATLAPMSPSYTALSEGFVSIPMTYTILGAVWLLASAYLLMTARQSRAAIPVMPLAVLTAVIGVSAWVFVGYRGIPNAVLWVAVCFAILWFLMDRTAYGRNSYLIGSNHEAARLAGIPIKKYLLSGFVLMGVLYGVAATLMTARLSASTPTSGLYLELDAIAAAVIGGISLRGGIGKVGGALVGAALLVTIDNGMSILNISTFVQMMVKGMVLLLALAADVTLNKKK